MTFERNDSDRAPYGRTVHRGRGLEVHLQQRVPLELVAVHGGVPALGLHQADGTYGHLEPSLSTMSILAYMKSGPAAGMGQTSNAGKSGTKQTSLFKSSPQKKNKPKAQAKVFFSDLTPPPDPASPSW